ncbi:ParA family protein [Actinoallomurus purpureus]|uniref:ParA family protein n=1 Tax=Actinoallomurus purpureus TaxID=478114 RepID=UPI0020920B5F|nr:ParA family protein [Actinoallomurus purpureus]MCO6011542.1 ParA family protein [Actinoallomurus purpureus]
MAQPIGSAQYSEKGGVGKTSDTDGLAAVAAERGLNVGVVDGDPRATATAELGVEVNDDTLTLNDLLVIPAKGDPPDPAEVVQDVLQPAGKAWPSNIRVIPAERNLAHRESDPAPIETRLARAILGAPEIDIWFFDLPPRPGGKLITTLLAAATTVLIPATLTTDGFIGVEQARRSIRLIRQGMNPGLGYTGIIRSIVPKDSERRGVHDEVDAALADTYPGEVLDVQITEYAIREEARLACVPITSAPGREAKILIGKYGELLDHLLTRRSLWPAAA